MVLRQGAAVVNKEKDAETDAETEAEAAEWEELDYV